jgi:hypothetical protein
MIINLQKIPTVWVGGLNATKDNNIKLLCEELQLNPFFIEAIKTENNIWGPTKVFEKVLEKVVENNTPTLFIEDDVKHTEHYTPIIDVPDDTDAVWLGTSVYGLVDNWMQMKLGESIYLNRPTKLGEYKDYYRIHNMLSIHAVLFITQNYVKEIQKYLKYNVNTLMPPDIAIASTMKNFNIYACKQPMFFQDDNAHNYQPTITPLTKIFKNE